MNRVIILILLQVLFMQSLKGQCRKIDSLRHVLVSLRAIDSNRVNSLNSLAQELFKSEQVKQAKFYAAKSLELAMSLSYDKGIADAKIIYGKTLEEDVIEHTKSPKLYKEALKVYNNNRFEKRKTVALKYLGDYYYNFLYLNRGYFKMALEYYLQYLEAIEKIGSKKEVFEAYTLLIRLHENEGNNEKSLKYVKKALELKKELEQEDIDDPHLLQRVEKNYDLKLANQQLFSYSLLAGLALLAIIASLLIYFVVQKQKVNKKLQEQNDEIIAKSQTIEEQNTELTQKNEEISSQRDQLMDQNQQILDTQEELQISNENLAKTNKELEQAKQKLEDINQYLEVKVEDRTQDLNKSNARLKVVNKELDTLLYRASHDFKGPVATLKGLMQITKIEYGNGNNPDLFFKKIECTTDRMDYMLTNLHKVSYVIGKKIQRQTVDLKQVLEQVKIEYQLELKEANAKIEFYNVDDATLSSDFEVWVIIFEKIIENAIHFRNTQDSLEVDVEITQSDTETQITIKDNGVGIPTERQSEVFSMFYRGSERSKGNGLGLYVVKKAIEGLKGEVVLFSKEDSFTMFKIQIPR